MDPISTPVERSSLGLDSSIDIRSLWTRSFTSYFSAVDQTIQAVVSAGSELGATLTKGATSATEAISNTAQAVQDFVTSSDVVLPSATDAVLHVGSVVQTNATALQTAALDLTEVASQSASSLLESAHSNLGSAITTLTRVAQDLPGSEKMVEIRQMIETSKEELSAEIKNHLDKAEVVNNLILVISLIAIVSIFVFNFYLLPVVLLGVVAYLSWECRTVIANTRPHLAALEKSPPCILSTSKLLRPQILSERLGKNTLVTALVLPLLLPHLLSKKNS